MTKRPIDYYLLWGVALLSLLINLGFGYALLVARSKAGQGAQTAAQAVAALRASTIDYPVHIEQSLPVSLTILSGPESSSFSRPVNRPARL